LGVPHIAGTVYDPGAVDAGACAGNEHPRAVRRRPG
jgi:hypothetical protein